MDSLNEQSDILTEAGRGFVSPAKYEKLQTQRLYGERGWLLLVGCNSGRELAERIKEEYDSALYKIGKEENHEYPQVPLIPGKSDSGITRIFADGEMVSRLPIHVGGADSYVVACIHNMRLPQTPSDNLVELLITISALRTHGARRINVVLPYLPYSRGHHRSYMKREPTTAATVASLLKSVGTDSIIYFHPHTEDLTMAYEPLRLTPVNGLDLAVSIFWEYKGEQDIVGVAPDQNSGKLLRYLCEAMEWDMVYINKHRDPNTGEVTSEGINGKLEGKHIAVVFDDESVDLKTKLLTMGQLAQLNQESGGHIDRTWMYISHLKSRKEDIPTLKRLHEEYGVERIITTNSVLQIDEILRLPFVEVYDLAERLAHVINHQFVEASSSAGFFPKELHSKFRNNRIA